MRISDWSSDVCSSDLLQPRVGIALDPLGLPELIIGIPLPTRPEIPLQPEERVPDRIFGAVGVRSDFVVDAADGQERHPRRVHPGGRIGRQIGRSEEHTSELQSLMRISYAVFCLKQKKNKNTNNITALEKHQYQTRRIKIT